MESQNARKLKYYKQPLAIAYRKCDQNHIILYLWCMHVTRGTHSATSSYCWLSVLVYAVLHSCLIIFEMMPNFRTIDAWCKKGHISYYQNYPSIMCANLIWNRLGTSLGSWHTRFNVITHHLFANFELLV